MGGRIGVGCTVDLKKGGVEEQSFVPHVVVSLQTPNINALKRRADTQLATHQVYSMYLLCDVNVRS